jgi:hypothetical protein
VDADDGDAVRSKLVLLILLYTCVALTPLAHAQNDLAIIHRRVSCFPTNRFPLIRAEIQAASEVQSARVYFHSDLFTEIYFVEMAPTDNFFEAVLPMPGAATKRIVYYIEAVDAVFNTARTVTYDPSVDDACRQDPAALFAGESPGIIIGALEAGASAIPPGFQAAGIASLASAGGGISAAAAVAAAAGGAGAVGVVVATGGDGTTTTTVPTPATVTTTVPNGSTTSSTNTTTTTPGGSTTSVGPTSTTPTTSVPGSTTTTIPASEACFETKHLNFCRVKFDAQCSTGEIAAYAWEIDTEGVVGGPFLRIIPAEVYVHDFENCAGETIQTRLRVTDLEGRHDEITHSVTLPNSSSPPGTKSHSGASVSVSSQMQFRPTEQTFRGFVIFNGFQRDDVEGSAEFRHVFMGREGENQIEARVASELHGELLWRFDFSGSEYFLPGTIQVVEGQVSSRSGYAVVFRLRGEPGETLRFSYRLSNTIPSR